VQRTNCHPFSHGRWLFVHNGLINEFPRLRRDISMAIAPEYFPEISGTTDSELMFLLALTFGLEGDVCAGIARMTGFIESVAEKHGVPNAVQMTLGISDGESLYAVRYSTIGKSRTLYHSENRDAVGEMAPEVGRFSRDARAIVSEPLSGLEEAWVPVPESTFLTIRKGDVSCETFAPIPP